MMGGLEQSFPVPHKNLSLEIKGNSTDIFICRYDDHFLGEGSMSFCHSNLRKTSQVMATQIGTMGTILHARKEEGVSTEPTFSVSVILGKRDEPILLATARQLIEHISSSGSSMPLVLSLGLKDHSAETLRGIVSAVTENRLW
ncbi:Proteasome assembly chaperone 3 [Corchorus olitorius]|uniref:Proteasome assembly chaperone 3 n=1 Tax=Corchorus olitorius TaxID=93759 RepID=A0A1R3HGW9_9ROSI|nr:Proteasome assembly chaperone 3 [Corchorus olitorius]